MKTTPLRNHGELLMIIVALLYQLYVSGDTLDVLQVPLQSMYKFSLYRSLTILLHLGFRNLVNMFIIIVVFLGIFTQSETQEGHHKCLFDVYY